MYEQILDGSNINILIATLAGFITFFASCLLPLVPTYLSYLAGIAVTKNITTNERNILRREVFVNGLLFTVGFILTFILLGVAANSVGSFFAEYKVFLSKLGGAFLILMGLLVLEIVKPLVLLKEYKFTLPSSIRTWKKLNSFLVGVTFGLAWTPCIGPILAVILFWASQEATLLKGTLLLTFYGIGMGIPFLISAYFFDSIADVLIKVKGLGKFLQTFAGVLIITTGVLLLTGKLSAITLTLFQILKLDSLAL